MTVFEADASPLAVQGPKAEDVVAALFGGWVRDIRYFWFRETVIEDIPVAVARSGWSKQGGFELYLLDRSKGTALWNLVREAGAPFDIGPGNPNPSERVESGLLSWGGDTDDRTNPFEVRLGGFVDLDVDDDVIGIKALRSIEADGPERQQLGVLLEGDRPAALSSLWFDIVLDGRKVGDLTNCAWSYRLKRNIGFGLVSSDLAPGQKVSVIKDGTAVDASLRTLPFI